MTEIDVTPMRKSSVAYLHGLRESINVEPVYQRQGAVWSVKSQQLLIDSIINNFDVPKIYVHEHGGWIESDGKRFRYSLVDGKQRLEAIWDFLDGKFALSQDFVRLEDGSKEAAGKNYEQLKKEHPEIAAEFAATSLDVMAIRTGDIELIEEMFSRLNEAVPLNAAEKRNGWGGPLRQASRDLVQSDFFVNRLPFSNSRYRHLDLAAKFFLWAEKEDVADTKKRQLDAFWHDVRDNAGGDARADRALAGAKNVTNEMSRTFLSKDTLLSSVGMVSLYFLLFQSKLASKESVPSRTSLLAFNKVRRIERPADEDSMSSVQRQLLEFDRLAQSSNDEQALRTRLSIINDFLNDPKKFEE
ncbi:DUF262 domain-containing protein [Vibrio cholerae]|nr:DUF262 domain-containing protein [Vibrio cholerae]